MAVHSTSGNDAGHRRPKGILKRKSEQQMAGQAAVAAAAAAAATTTSAIASNNSTPLPLTTSNIKELTLQNTSKNAGKRRGSSVSRSATSRKLSIPGANGTSSVTDQQQQPPHTPEAASHLTWDEANLILHEQNKVPRMKIDEPKTPFAPHYIPDEDEDMLMEGDIPSLDIGEAEQLDPQQQQQQQQGGNWGSGFSLDGGSARIDKVDEGADLEPPRERRLSSSSHGSEKHVGVHPKDASPTHDAEREPQSEDEKRKHDMFEKKRKQHYEMSGIKNLLGKSIDIEEDDDDEDDNDGNDNNDDDYDNDSNDQDGDVDMDSGNRRHKKDPPPVPPIPEQYKSSRK